MFDSLDRRNFYLPKNIQVINWLNWIEMNPKLRNQLSMLSVWSALIFILCLSCRLFIWRWYGKKFNWNILHWATLKIYWTNSKRWCKISVKWLFNFQCEISNSSTQRMAKCTCWINKLWLVFMNGLSFIRTR